MSEPDSDTREPANLSTLPFELLLKIVEPLDIASARSLSRTCSILRDAAERRIWEEVDITSGYGSQGEDLSRVPYIVYEKCGKTVDSKIQHVVSAIISHRTRLDWISVLRIEPSDGPRGVRARRLISLVKMLSPRLKRIDFLPLPIDPDDPLFQNTYVYKAFSDEMDEADIEFPKILHLKIAFETNRSLVYYWILRGMQNLREIEVCSSSEYWSTFIFGEPDGQSLPNVTRFTISGLKKDMYDRSMKVLATFVSVCPNLSCLRMEGEWYVDGREKAMPAMVKSKNLKTLIIKYGRPVTFASGPPVIEFFALGGLGIEEVVLDSYGWDELHETDLKEIALPHAADLKRITLLTTPRMPLSQYASLSLDPPPLETRLIPQLFLAHLKKCPQLSTILLLHLVNPFPSTYDPNFVEPEYFPPSVNWERDGHRGMVIRQFTRPDALATEDAFWHIRMLSRTVRGPTDHGLYVGPRRCWQDFVNFGRWRVSRGLLEVVYRLSGLDMEFYVGGRQLELSQTAWELLEEWTRCL